MKKVVMDLVHCFLKKCRHLFRSEIVIVSSESRKKILFSVYDTQPTIFQVNISDETKAISKLLVINAQLNPISN